MIAYIEPEMTEIPLQVINEIVDVERSRCLWAVRDSK